MLRCSVLCFLLCFLLCFRRLEILSFLNFSNFSLLFASCFLANCQCSNSSSCDIDSALSVSVSCNTSVAILTLLEAVLQHFCSSTLCLQQGRGSTLVSLFLLLWRHNVVFFSRSSFNIFFYFSPSDSFVVDVFPSRCIPMSYKSSIESSCSTVQLIRTVHPAVLRHMLLGILVQPCSLVGYKPWHQSSSGPYILHFHRNV